MGTIEVIRQLAKSGKITYSGHATSRMISRNISSESVEKTLCANDNQIVETQSPSSIPGREHQDSRYLVYSPSKESIVVISSLISRPNPEILVVTIERVDDTVWDKVEGGNPAIIRKTT